MINLLIGIGRGRTYADDFPSDLTTGANQSLPSPGVGRWLLS
jgi:hypothetical protein